jgi:hypothetical protein
VQARERGVTVDYVWAVTDLPRELGTELFVIPRSSADDLGETLTLFRQCHTWGELRNQASPEKFQEIAGLAGYEDFGAQSAHLLIGKPVPGALAAARAEFEEDTELPDDDAEFNAYDIGAVADGDYPPYIYYLMALHVPSDLIDAHGEQYETVFNGTYARFDAAAAKPVIDGLVAAAHSCTEDRALIDAAIRD